ncbi:hypothetical protein HLRTI_000486 [Halorhabdus tiamatea SARL4B]|uniref:Uncharacterized protein n=1 Tax=Halorhabdus tiamatea SARL4B TaxID=1033806 RepID=F7PMN8_9EURY|nr:hypothetical protein [Halorhabdus tiamatea]ERJ07444.1 hypothetical protein HLRTI_000486 [Halorhabdus tiamatea SARL4B]
MGITPELPEGTPHEVGGWSFDPEPYNGAAWFGDDRRVSVAVFTSLDDTAFAKVFDERVSGGYTYILGEDPEQEIDLDEAFEKGVSWMKTHDPENWHHPRVDPAVFDVPDGYDLAHYGLGQREVTIRYALRDFPDELRAMKVRINGFDSTDNWTVEINRTPITVGHGEEIWKPEKGTPLSKVLTRVRRFAAAIREDPSLVTEPDRREIDGEDLLENGPTPSRPQNGQTELFHYERVS